MSKASRLFGTDGIRGRALEGALAPASVVRIGRALAELARERTRDDHPRILVARDPRTSGPELRDAVVRGLAAGGARVLDAGVIPTPGAAWTGDRKEAALVVMVSASHNPPEDNGIKVFQPNAHKLDDEGERAVEEKIARMGSSGEDAPEAHATAETQARSRYLDELARSEQGLRLDGLKVVVDAGFGAAAKLGTELLARLGAEVIPLHDEPDGTRIGVNVGAVHPEVVAAAVKRERAQVGVAFDGDADRCLFADHEGNVRDGDDALYVLGRALSSRGQLAKNVVVGTSMTNGGLRAALAKHGVNVECVDGVGDRFIAERLRKNGYVLGGEPSGHLICTRWLGTGDGMFTALAVLRELRRSGSSLAQLCRGFERFPQLLEAEPSPASKPPLETLPKVKDTIARHARELEAKGGRLVVRYSGTEPVLRVMAEGPASVDLSGIVRSVREAFRSSTKG